MLGKSGSVRFCVFRNLRTIVKLGISTKEHYRYQVYFVSLKNSIRLSNLRSLHRITPLVFRNVHRRSGKRPLQFAILTFILLVSVGNIIGPASARVQTARFVVSFKPQVGQIERTQAVNMAGGHVTSQFGIINGPEAKIPLRPVDMFRSNPTVAGVEVKP